MIPQTRTSADQQRLRLLALVPMGIALNLSLGTLVHAVRLPVYIDEVGTICVTLLVGLRAGLVTGVLSFLIGGPLTNPVLPWFTGTQVAVALYTHFLGKKGFILTLRRTILSGIGLGVVAGVVSAPVVVLVFGGLSGSGAALITAFLLASGKTVLQSVVFAGLASEPLDKTLQLLLARYILRSIPRSIMDQFSNPALKANGLQ